MPHHVSRPARTAALSAALLLVFPLPLLAATPAPALPAAAVESDVLKVLPASHDEMVFRGENSDAAWPVYFSRTEAARTGVFQLGLLNTVSLLPERSTLRVAINGRTLTNMQIRSPEKVTTLPVRIPPGVLVPGFNAVQISVAMAHRVDCSVKATYELWTLLDPAQTGFLVPAQAAATVRTIDDLGADVAAEDGTTRIHLRLPVEVDENLLNRGADAISAIVARARLLRPVVDVGPEPGTGPGFDVILGADPEQVGAAGGPTGMTFRRDGGTHRMVIAMPFEQAAPSASNGSELRALGTPQGVRSFENLSGLAVDGERRLTFAELGRRSDASTGRRYLNFLGVTLPDDFYPGSYNKVTLFLDGTHVPTLADAASLVFRVNGTLVSSLPLGPSSPERFDHAQVDLPLQFFRPGYNEVEIEGLMPAASDEQCDLTAAPSGPRLTIADTSELLIPRFARLRTSPQIMSTMRFGTGESKAPVDIYLTGSEPRLIGAGLTVVANMAARDRIAGRSHVHLDQPSRADNSGIVIGSLSALPDSLAAPLRNVTDIGREVGASLAGPESGILGQATPTDPDQAVPDASPSAASPRSSRDRVVAAYKSAQQWIRKKGFFFADAEGEGPRLSVSDRSLIVADVLTEQRKPLLGRVDLPRFVATPKDWVVVTATTEDGIADGLRSLVANSHWKDLNGEAVVYEPNSGKLQAMQARNLSYVLPDRLPFGDLRPILGGVMSSNIVLSTIVLLVLLSLLGMTTHVLLRFVGERPK